MMDHSKKEKEKKRNAWTKQQFPQKYNSTIRHAQFHS